MDMDKILRVAGRVEADPDFWRYVVVVETAKKAGCGDFVDGTFERDVSVPFSTITRAMRAEHDLIADEGYEVDEARHGVGAVTYKLAYITAMRIGGREAEESDELFDLTLQRSVPDDVLEAVDKAMDEYADYLDGKRDRYHMITWHVGR